MAARRVWGGPTCGRGGAGHLGCEEALLARRAAESPVLATAGSSPDLDQPSAAQAARSPTSSLITSVSPDPGSHSLIASPLQRCLLRSVVYFRARVVFLSHLKGACGQTFFLNRTCNMCTSDSYWVAVNICFMDIYFADIFRITLLPASCLFKTVHVRTLL